MEFFKSQGSQKDFLSNPPLTIEGFIFSLTVSFKIKELGMEAEGYDSVFLALI